MPERYAIYYAPPAQSDLWQRAAQWLGRDAASGEIEPVPIGNVAVARRFELTQSARRYGFHATIKPPMALPAPQTVATLETEMTSYALTRRPVDIGRLEVRVLGGFLALMPVEQTQALTDFAAEVVEHFEPFRAALGPMDRERRLALGLNERQTALLDRYGYPYVMDHFLFHMTIADRLPETDLPAMVHAATEWFAPALIRPLVLDRLTLFHEPTDDAGFVRLGDFPLLSKHRV